MMCYLKRLGAAGAVAMLLVLVLVPESSGYALDLWYAAGLGPLVENEPYLATPGGHQ